MNINITLTSALLKTEVHRQAEIVATKSIKGWKNVLIVAKSPSNLT